jgi:hypothetical protein
VEQFWLEHANGFAGEAQRLCFAFKLSRFERDPTERSLGAPAHAPTELCLLELPATGGKLRIHALYGVSADMLKAL